ncbi:CPXCG motif-containing cysteine-rich protein [Moheibacter sp.]|uniref:CPXCG motif-containing cysteine-rich protein n=1 Tax=Moheibacter sp. TaxID=1965316 RepID=UPI003C776F2A
MHEQFFTCPHCWEEISMLIDTSVSFQKYVEDCEVCCNPIEITATCENGELIGLNVSKID